MSSIELLWNLMRYRAVYKNFIQVTSLKKLKHRDKRVESFGKTVFQRNLSVLTDEQLSKRANKTIKWCARYLNSSVPAISRSNSISKRLSPHTHVNIWFFASTNPLFTAEKAVVVDSHAHTGCAESFKVLKVLSRHQQNATTLLTI